MIDIILKIACALFLITTAAFIIVIAYMILEDYSEGDE